ncbi:lanC-like protein GCR2 isoform X2 [Diospyros lotus]|uniref:lanC-like protein GCR2 isoform X2 n=1 Tax=Diospyros lotus TaxID=55363 RepID=UPI00225BB606|nr:lanC-like protein GCR2 isoform X2 [Diospyros lotus]
MADRFFPNEMPDFVPENPVEGSIPGSSGDPLSKLLHIPYKAVAERLKLAALDLKEIVVKETWGLSGRRVSDYTVYTGALGTAYLLFKAYQISNNKDDLKLCSEIVKACDAASRNSERVTFICGRAGVCALGAVVAKHSGDERLFEQYLTKFKEIELPEELPNELLYGRAGFLWACSFLNKMIGKDTVSSRRTRPVVDEIIKSGRRLGKKERCPLMYEWHGKKYWGAAHGLAGIMHVLMDMELKPDEVEDVKGTLRYMIRNRFPSGNYPSSQESESDRLVHWCHGAPGVALALVKAAEVFGDEEFVKAAIDAGKVVWERGLLKRVGICHGISGNSYVFLALYRLTGIGGMAYLFLDMTEPSEARFPAYEL